MTEGGSGTENLQIYSTSLMDDPLIISVTERAGGGVRKSSNLRDVINGGWGWWLQASMSDIP